MWATITAAAGALIGLMLVRNLATLRYRRPDEREFPVPPRAWWLIPALVVVWGWLTWHHQEQPWPVLALWLPLAATLGWLSAVDLDVRRLPDAVALPAAGWVTAVLATQAIATDSPTRAVVAAAIGLTAGAAAWILHLASRGGVGFGDVKLVTILAAAIALVSPSLVLPALFASCLVAIAVALITRRHEFAFGPSLALGCVMTMGLASLA